MYNSFCFFNTGKKRRVWLLVSISFLEGNSIADCLDQDLQRRIPTDMTIWGPEKNSTFSALSHCRYLMQKPNGLILNK